MATVNLGAIKFNFRGAFNNATAYVADDVVTSSGSSYVCILASTGNAVSSGSHWSLMAQAGVNGANGTDVGTTITTQGDILYRDGSGLQRLAKGTASQSLTMNSGATAPEWTTPSGGTWIKIGSVTASNNATVDITGLSTTYDTYAIVMADMKPATDDVDVGLRLGDSSGIDSGGGDYSYVVRATSVYADWGWMRSGSHDFMKLTSAQEVGSGTGEGFGGLIYLQISNQSSVKPSISGTCTWTDSASDLHTAFIGARHNNRITVDRVQFLFSSGNVTSGRFSVFGIKHT